MNERSFCYCIFIVGLFILLYFTRHDIEYFISREYVKSSIDGRNYPVVGSFEGEREAADMLARINDFLLKVIKHMKKKYIVNGEGGKREKEATLLLLDRYNPDVLFENNPVGLENTSYVSNKGESIGFCLREKKTGNNDIHHWGIVQFVALHEISHIITEEYGHGVEFWYNFKFMINEAIDSGLYRSVNYAMYPEKYCGVLITYSPEFDPTL